MTAICMGMCNFLKATGENVLLFLFPTNHTVITTPVLSLFLRGREITFLLFV